MLRRDFLKYSIMAVLCTLPNLPLANSVFVHPWDTLLLDGWEWAQTNPNTFRIKNVGRDLDDAYIYMIEDQYYIITELYQNNDHTESHVVILPARNKAELDKTLKIIYQDKPECHTPKIRII